MRCFLRAVQPGGSAKSAGCGCLSIFAFRFLGAGSDGDVALLPAPGIDQIEFNKHQFHSPSFLSGGANVPRRTASRRRSTYWQRETGTGYAFALHGTVCKTVLCITSAHPQCAEEAFHFPSFFVSYCSLFFLFLRPHDRKAFAIATTGSYCPAACASFFSCCSAYVRSRIRSDWLRSESLIGAPRTYCL